MLLGHEKEIDVNIKNKSGNTPLHWASINGHLPVVKALVAGSANVDIKSDSGHTPAGDAEMVQKWDVVNFLLERSADIDNKMVEIIEEDFDEEEEEEEEEEEAGVEKKPIE